MILTADTQYNDPLMNTLDLENVLQKLHAQLLASYRLRIYRVSSLSTLSLCGRFIFFSYTGPDEFIIDQSSWTLFKFFSCCFRF